MKRIQSLMNEPLYTEYVERNSRSEKERLCPHNMSHHFDVARITYILILENNDLDYFIKESKLSSRMAAKEVIYAAGLLHDIGKWAEYREGIDHSSYSAKLARGLLPRALFNYEEIEIISRAIDEHENQNDEMSFLGEKLYRAENLSRICSQCQHNTQCGKINSKEANADLIEY
ncbi:MAG: HD domain-containing protein [Syntrophomonadaceae bacterium]|nr:HD domain-containing protein [Syntrophomonadaceae bacterium]